MLCYSGTSITQFTLKNKCLILDCNASILFFFRLFGNSVSVFHPNSTAKDLNISEQLHRASSSWPTGHSTRRQRRAMTPVAQYQQTTQVDQCNLIMATVNLWKQADTFSLEKRSELLTEKCDSVFLLSLGKCSSLPSQEWKKQ